MNPNAPNPSSPLAMLTSIWLNRNMIYQLTKHEISGLYRGSFLGFAWSFFNPILMLSIYTFVFSTVFKARWNVTAQNNQTEYALVIFVGIIIHSFLAQVIGRAPTQILSNTNYVKKVVFPLEILSIVDVLSALFHAVMSFAVLILIIIFISGIPSSTAILIPLTILPLVPLLLGLSWIFSSLGTYIRDLSQFVGLAISALMFLAPIFYPITAVPKNFQSIMLCNPLTIPIMETRQILLFDTYPNWNIIALYWIFSLTICFVGFWCFQRSRKGFSDVI